jgi:GalNAc-alpha-(1->4)-GalNAc-alpha-(1->3)-diNAcBac-PP-undecaprenol alpha-1,4-N-acetyl-D-galactosaminyltransferase
MRLLFVIDHLNAGGAQRQLVNLAIGLAHKGHVIEFFVYYPHDFFAQQLKGIGIKINHHYKTHRYSFDVLSSLSDLIKRNEFDCMVSFLKTPNFYAELLKSFTTFTMPKLIVSERYCDACDGHYFQTKTLRQFHRFADYVTVNSHHQRVALEKEYTWIRNKICTIYNGVDLETFYPAAREKTFSNQLKLLAIASISFRKNGLRLINALEILRDKYHIYPLVRWIGEHQMHIPHRRRASIKMKDEIKRLQLENQWEWLEHRNDIPQLMRSHDALIHPAYFEGLPNVVCEALATGLPVLVSDTLDHPRLVQHGASGFLFDPYSPEAIAEAIYRFSKLDDSERSKMSESARLYAEKELSLDLYVDKYEKLLLSIVEQR